MPTMHLKINMSVKLHHFIKRPLTLPKGNRIFSNDQITRNLIDQIKSQFADENDDDFFHTTCHVDATTQTRIGRGEFIELEKLKQQMNRHLHEDDEGKLMNIANKDGCSYFVPANSKDSKITNVKTWDKVFRIYTTIYSRINPHRASEILQYVDIIHTAASTFNWENVAAYDYVFRHLMAQKPNRSWAKTYTQMWNLTLCGGVNKFGLPNNGNSNRAANNTNSNNNYSNRGRQSGSSSWKDHCCWRFNKGGKCKFGRECRFDHRCNYCGSYSHYAQICPKRTGGSSQSNSSTKKHDKKHEKRNHDQAN